MSNKNWEETQVKVFSRWCAKHLKARNIPFESLRNEFSDGVKLINLFEIIGKEKINERWHAKPKNRFQTLENCETAINFICGKKKVRLIGIHPEDIVDKNLKITLGLIWSCILKFFIEDVSFENAKSRDALFNWCKKYTEGHEDVNITNFTTSWSSGLGFCALINHFRPDVLNYSSLNKKDHAQNCYAAFEACNKLGITSYLDPEDLIDTTPDEKSVIIQISEFFHFFSDPTNVRQKVEVNAIQKKDPKKVVKKTENHPKKIDEEEISFPQEDQIENDNFFVGEDEQQFYKTIKKIGEGGTAIVYKVIDTRTDQIYCKKVLKMADEKSAYKRQQSAMKEFDILRTITHPCICRAYKINTQEPLRSDIDNPDEDEDDSELTTISLYLEFLPKSLKECIDKKVLDNTMKVKIAVEIAHALNYIHKHGLIHRDVKIENIMLNSDLDAKVVDFGLVRIDECFNGQSYVTNTMTRGIGTLYYMSPEMINKEEYDNTIDVYSYGIALYYLLFGQMPQYSMKEKMHEKPIPMPQPSSSITKFGINLITKCTEYNASKRPSFEEILKEMRENSFEIASEIDLSLISKRDHELTLFESTHK